MLDADFVLPEYTHLNATFCNKVISGSAFFLHDDEFHHTNIRECQRVPDSCAKNLWPKIKDDPDLSKHWNADSKVPPNKAYM